MTWKCLSLARTLHVHDCGHFSGLVWITSDHDDQVSATWTVSAFCGRASPEDETRNPWKHSTLVGQSPIFLSEKLQQPRLHGSSKKEWCLILALYQDCRSWLSLHQFRMQPSQIVAGSCPPINKQKTITHFKLHDEHEKSGMYISTKATSYDTEKDRYCRSTLIHNRKAVRMIPQSILEEMFLNQSQIWKSIGGKVAACLYMPAVRPLNTRTLQNLHQCDQLSIRQMLTGWLWAEILQLIEVACYYHMLPPGKYWMTRQGKTTKRWH